MSISHNEILTFWFSEPMKSHWFSSTEDIDNLIRDNFENLWEQASRGECDDWMQTADGSLALVIVLDQFPLNMFRGTKKSFSTEAKSIEVTKQALAAGQDQQIKKDHLAFLYMPLMHSENDADQALSVSLFERAGLDENVKFAKHHQGIVKRFGRFPHRNKILGRVNTEEEQQYLNSDEAFKG